MIPPQPTRPLTLALVAGLTGEALELSTTLARLFPGSAVIEMDTDAERVLPAAVDCAIIEASVHDTPGLDVLRQLRARGYAGSAVLLASSPVEDGADEAAARLGARWCVVGEGDAGLITTAVAEALRLRAAVGEAGVGGRDQAEVQRLIAAGELALRLQHALNNPLAALLAEAQLLELEPLAADHRTAVERIIELTRRVVDVVRGLDGVGRA